jgi:hypothetical protein
MGAVFGWTWLIGMLVALSVMRVRAGAGFWLGLKIGGPTGFPVLWVAQLLVCSMFWPVTLVVWLVRGRPEPRWVFNHKAEERQALQDRR